MMMFQNKANKIGGIHERLIRNRKEDSNIRNDQCDMSTFNVVNQINRFYNQLYAKIF